MSVYVPKFTAMLTTHDYLMCRQVGWQWGEVEIDNWRTGHDEESSDPRDSAPDWTRGQYQGNVEDFIDDLPAADDDDQEACAVREAYIAACEEVVDDAACEAWEAGRP